LGDIQVVGVTADANDSFTFVLWKDIAANTIIRFMDQSFTNATTGLLGTETDMSLTFPSALAVGTVIRVEDTGSTLVNGGTFSGTKTGSLSGISASGDQVFIYQGTAVGSGTSFSGRTLLYGFNIADTNWVASGADSNNSFLPTAISGQDMNVDSGNFDNADYAGARTGLTTAAYRAAVANLANFTQSDTRTALATGGFISTSTASLHWDANGTVVGDGGSATWDTTTQSRFKNGAAGSTYLHWVNSTTGNDHTAVFGGTAGAVSVASGGVTASGLQFDVSGYTVQNNTVTLSATATPALQVTTAGHTATISSALAGTQGFTKTGPGTLVLSGNNPLSGAVSVTGGTLTAAASTANQSLGSATSVSVTGGTLLLGADDQIHNTAPLTLGTGGTFDLGGFSEGSTSADGLGALVLAASAGIDFGTLGNATSLLRFGSVGTRTGNLAITDYDTVDRLLFSGTLTDPGTFEDIYGQANISFNGVSGFNAIQFGGYYEVVPVPEPTTVFGAFGLLGFIGWRERRRLRSILA